MTSIFSQIESIGKLLDAASLRHKVISQNVANVNTPSYQRLEVQFEELLAKATSSNGEIPDDIQPIIEQTRGLVQRQDGNNVNIDAEMGLLSKNTLLHESYTQVLASKLTLLRSAITGRQ